MLRGTITRKGLLNSASAIVYSLLRERERLLITNPETDRRSYPSSTVWLVQQNVILAAGTPPATTPSSRIGFGNTVYV
ncbi:hypothetical protein J6590_008279 [Homalodisca vitripennis]|nr:hypothetical protein J6590_008279 [Homalodisca vitripennis]